MRALVTGASGFVGGYLVDALRENGADVFPCGGPHDGGEMLALDLRDSLAIRAALDIAQPDVLFHLAAQTFVPDSLQSPIDTYETNAIGTARLTEAVRGYVEGGAKMPRILFTSSAEVYGAQAPERFPLDESVAPHPDNPYAASKAAAEALLIGEARSFKLDVVIARAFNHIGPGQSERFVVPNFAAQLASIAENAGGHLMVGNLDARRDFLDVRDVVAAYVALARDGVSGEIYNVCSGVARSIRDVLRDLIIAAHVPVEVREDPARMRPSDVPLFVGNNAKLRAATGWEPRVPWARSVRDIYEAARKKSAP